MIVIIMIRDHHYIVIKIVIISILIILTTTTQASARLAAELGFTRILTSGGAATALQVEKDSSSFPLDHHQTLKNIFD